MAEKAAVLRGERSTRATSFIGARPKVYHEIGDDRLGKYVNRSRDNGVLQPVMLQPKNPLPLKIAPGVSTSTRVFFSFFSFLFFLSYFSLSLSSNKHTQHIHEAAVTNQK